MARSYPENAQMGITTPPIQNFNTPAMEGSMQQFLADNIGQYVVVEFLVGTNELTAKAGVLYAVGTSVVTLYQELTQTYVTCDMFSIKFVTFYLPGHRPWQVNFPMSQESAVPSQWPTTPLPGAMATPAPGFAGSMAAPGQWSGSGQDFAVQGGCVGGNCGGGATQSWG